MTKKKTQSSRRDTRETAHEFHRSEIILGFLVIVLTLALVSVIVFHPFGKSPGEPSDASSDYLAVEQELHAEEKAEESGSDESDDPDDDLPRKTDIPPEPISLSDEEVVTLQTEAEKGDAEAEFRLAKDYYYTGANKNLLSAFEFFRKAAEQGHAEAQYWTGRCYDFGEGTAADRVEAALWYQKAADQGNTAAQYRLSEFYENGYGVPRDPQAALAWFQKAAQQGDPVAQYKLGLRYAAINTPENLEEAFRWFRKSAMQGNGDAQYWVGRCYKRGKGVDEDYAEAAVWLRKAALQGHAAAQYELGNSYEFGLGLSPDPEAALLWYKRAASRGNTDALRLLRDRKNKDAGASSEE